MTPRESEYLDLLHAEKAEQLHADGLFARLIHSRVQRGVTLTGPKSEIGAVALANEFASYTFVGTSETRHIVARTLWACGAYICVGCGLWMFAPEPVHRFNARCGSCASCGGAR